MTIEKKMNFVLVPFKTFKNAKTRLRKDLSDLDTEYIVKIMLEDVLEQVSRSKIAEKKFILTADEEAIKIAKKLNIEILKEKNQISESSSVDKASSFLKKEGASGVLRLPGDIPLVTASNIESILEVGIKKKSSVLVPSESKTGTNAFYKYPPDVISSSFGANSFNKHVESFKKQKIKYEVLEIENIGLDVDSLEDLKKLKSSMNKCKTIECIKTLSLLPQEHRVLP